MEIRGCFSSQFNETVTILYEQTNIFENEEYTAKIKKEKSWNKWKLFQIRQCTVSSKGVSGFIWMIVTTLKQVCARRPLHKAIFQAERLKMEWMYLPFLCQWKVNAVFGQCAHGVPGDVYGLN